MPWLTGIVPHWITIILYILEPLRDDCLQNIAAICLAQEVAVTWSHVMGLLESSHIGLLLYYIFLSQNGTIVFGIGCHGLVGRRGSRDMAPCGWLTGIVPHWITTVNSGLWALFELVLAPRGTKWPKLTGACVQHPPPP